MEKNIISIEIAQTAFFKKKPANPVKCKLFALKEEKLFIFFWNT